MNIEELSQIIGFLTAATGVLVLTLGTARFVLLAKLQEEQKSLIETELMWIESRESKPSLPQPKPLRIEDVGIIEFINQ